MNYNNGIYYDKMIIDSLSFPQSSDKSNVPSYKDISFWHKHRRNCIVEVINRWNECPCFFDIGGGDGYYSEKLQDLGYNVFLIEPRPNLVAIAKNDRKIDNILCGYFNANTVKESSVPCIGIFDVLEHIENDVEFLAELYSLMASEGKIFIAVPAYDFLWSKKDDYSKHYRRYSFRQLKSVVEKSGFTVVFSTYFFSILLLPILLLKALPYRVRKNKMPTNKKSTSNSTGSVQNEQKSSFVTKLLSPLFYCEKSLMRHRIRIPFGSSILLVAKKK